MATALLFLSHVSHWKRLPWLMINDRMADLLRRALVIWRVNKQTWHDLLERSRSDGNTKRAHVAETQLIKCEIESTRLEQKLAELLKGGN
jgi:hypothetical protein